MENIIHENDRLDESGVQCTRCRNYNGTYETHGCPFDEEINGDYEERCNCCPDCTHECAMDI